jgi:hypothetical protein
MSWKVTTGNWGDTTSLSDDGGTATPNFRSMPLRHGTSVAPSVFMPETAQPRSTMSPRDPLRRGASGAMQESDAPRGMFPSLRAETRRPGERSAAPLDDVSELARPGSSRLNQLLQPTHNQRWITVFGVSGGNILEVLPYIRRSCGEFSLRKSFPGEKKQFHIRFNDPFSAQKAASMKRLRIAHLDLDVGLEWCQVNSLTEADRNTSASKSEGMLSQDALYPGNLELNRDITDSPFFGRSIPNYFDWEFLSSLLVFVILLWWIYQS